MTYHPFIANLIISGQQSGLKCKVRCSSIKNIWMMNEINIMAREWMSFPSLLGKIITYFKTLQYWPNIIDIVCRLLPSMQNTLTSFHHDYLQRARLTKANDVTVKKYRKSHIKMLVKCMLGAVWGHNFVWNSKWNRWNFTQHLQLILHRICILRCINSLMNFDILKSFHRNPKWDGPLDCPDACSVTSFLHKKLTSSILLETNHTT